MATKILLTIIALIYIGLAVWCSIDPTTTSAKVGFGLNGGAGQSEFLTIYGGLEFGMALIFLLPWCKKDATQFSLLSCVLMHGSLVAFRTISLIRFADIDPFTHQLATGEWVIFLICLAFWFWNRKAQSSK